MDVNTIRAISFADVDLLAGIKVSGEWVGSEGRLRIEGIKTFEQLSALFGAFAGKPAIRAGIQEALPLDEPQVAQPQLSIVKSPVPEEFVTAGAAAPIEVEDLSVFGTLAQLKDIIGELRRRGAKDFDDIRSRVMQLKEAEMCPALDKIQGLEDRLRSSCVALKIPGALP